MAGTSVTVEVAGHEVAISNPDKVFFAARGATKLDLVEYYCAVGEAALRGVDRRPTVLKRFPDGADGPSFFQKRVPKSRPAWLDTVVVSFPSGNTAEELCPTDVGHIVWMVNLGCIDLNPWPVRREDLDHPDELRIDLDPQPGVSFDEVRRTALAVHELLAEYGIGGFPKTSGSRGMHVVIPIEPRWGFQEVRAAALVIARELERRMPTLVTAEWWKEHRGTKVFVDYNQNARDRTVASAYSVRATPDARVSTPLEWSEVADVEPEALTIATVPARVRALGDPAATLDDRRYSIAALVEEAGRAKAAGVPDAPWPPFFTRQEGEARRSRPSRARRDDV